MAYLIPETYSKPCQIYKMMRQIENPVIVKAVYSDVSRHYQGHTAIFSHGHIQALLRHIEPYSEAHLQTEAP